MSEGVLRWMDVARVYTWVMRGVVVLVRGCSEMDGYCDVARVYMWVTRGVVVLVRGCFEVDGYCDVARVHTWVTVLCMCTHLCIIICYHRSTATSKLNYVYPN